MAATLLSEYGIYIKRFTFNINPMKHITKLTLLSLTAAFCSCTETGTVDKEYMALENVKYINDIPTSYTLKAAEGKVLNLPIVHIEDFAISDSLFIASTGKDDGLIDILNLKDQTVRCSILRKRNARYEFMYSIGITLEVSLMHRDDTLYAYICNSPIGKLYKVNINKCLESSHTDITEVFEECKLPRDAFWTRMLNDTLLVTRSLEDMQTAQIRKLMNAKGDVVPSPVMDTLNRFKIPAKENFNIMSTLIAVSPDSPVCVEAPLGMNYINVYNPLESTGYTLCIGKKMDKLSDILRTERKDRRYMFADARSYHFGFAVLVFDIDEMTFQMNKKFTPSILLFDWQGNSLGKIDSDFKFNNFDIDERNRNLYVLNEDNLPVVFHLDSVLK